MKTIVCVEMRRAVPLTLYPPTHPVTTSSTPTPLGEAPPPIQRTRCLFLGQCRVQNGALVVRQERLGGQSLQTIHRSGARRRLFHGVRPAGARRPQLIHDASRGTTHELQGQSQTRFPAGSVSSRCSRSNSGSAGARVRPLASTVMRTFQTTPLCTRDARGSRGRSLDRAIGFEVRG